MSLKKHHQQELLASGISQEVIVGCQFCSASAEEAQQFLGWKRAPASGGLVIPYFDPGGELILVRIKLDQPRTSRDGDKEKVVKYEAPRGSRVRLYVPPPAVPDLAATDKLLLITEGEKKAASLVSHSFAAVGISGVTCWRNSTESKEQGKDILLEDFKWCELKGRQIAIIFDSDAAQNPKVRRQEMKLARALEKLGAEVACVRLPPGEGGAKVGVDDFLVARGQDGPQELRTLIEEAFQAGDVGCDQVHESWDDPHRLARRIHLHLFTGPTGSTLRFWREEFWEWLSPCYWRVARSEMRARLAKAIKAILDSEWLIMQQQRQRGRHGQQQDEDDDSPKVPQVGTRLITDVVEVLAGDCLVPYNQEQPLWLDGEGPWPARETLVTRDAVLHLPSLVAGRPCQIAPTPKLFWFNGLDYRFDPEASCPNWLAFLKNIWPDDPEAINLFWEWCGYLIGGDTSQHRALLIHGPPRSGKGTLGRILTDLLGKANVCAPILASFQSNFGLSQLLGKSLAIISDARISGRADAAVIVERLLSITGEDSQTADRKYREPVTLQLPTRLMILTNELPNLRDTSTALASRFLILQMCRSWLGREDRSLTKRLLKELPGILNWAIVGWDRLRRRGHFEQPASSRQLLETLEDISSPVSEFLREQCVVAPDQQIAVKDLFQRWQVWCKTMGREYPGSVQTLGRDLHSLVPGLKRVRQNKAGERDRTYRGLGLKQ